MQLGHWPRTAAWQGSPGLLINAAVWITQIIYHNYKSCDHSSNMQPCIDVAGLILAGHKDTRVSILGGGGAVGRTYHSATLWPSDQVKKGPVSTWFMHTCLLLSANAFILDNFVQVVRIQSYTRKTHRGLVWHWPLLETRQQGEVLPAFMWWGQTWWGQCHVLFIDRLI